MDKQPLLSICIPTYKRMELLRNTLHSIYGQNVKHDLFEVCISDDSPTDETCHMIEREFADIDNIFYRKTSECGYLNMIEAWKLGHGKLLKLQNDQAMLKDGSLKSILALIKANQKRKPLIFFGLRALKNIRKTLEVQNYNDFIRNIDYMSTYCSSMAIWKEDFDSIEMKGIQPNSAFPHTSFLFKQIDKKLYIIDNRDYIQLQKLDSKGGYNFPEYFIREYLTMIQTDLLAPGHIEKNVYDKLEKHILKFVAGYYWEFKYDPKYTFSFEDLEKIVEDCCGRRGLYIFYLYRMERGINWRWKWMWGRT